MPLLETLSSTHSLADRVDNTGGSLWMDEGDANAGSDLATEAAAAAAIKVQTSKTSCPVSVLVYTLLLIFGSNERRRVS